MLPLLSREVSIGYAPILAEAMNEEKLYRYSGWLHGRFDLLLDRDLGGARGSLSVEGGFWSEGHRRIMIMMTELTRRCKRCW